MTTTPTEPYLTPILDVRIEDHGSICIVQPLTPAAHAWVADHLPEDALRWAGGVVVEPRYVAEIVAGMTDDGLSVAPTGGGQ